MSESSKRQRKTVKIKTDLPIRVPRKWTEDEMETLFECITQYGHKDLEKIEERLPGRRLETIKLFMRTVYDTAVKMSEEHPNLDAWISRCGGETPWRDCLQVAQVMKYLSVDGLLENHPLPERCQGVNIPEAYRLIYQALMGYPIQPVNEQTANFIHETLAELANDVIKETDAINNVKSFFLKKSKPEETPQTSSSSGIKDELSDKQPQPKPGVRVYQRKKRKLDIAPEAVPSLKIVVQPAESDKPGWSLTQNFSVKIEGSGSESQSTVLNVPVPVMDSGLRVDKDEEELLQSRSYNPFQVPQQWLQEPVFTNLKLKI